MFDQITQWISDYVNSNANLNYYENPLVAYSTINNQFFRDLKRIANPNHLFPEQILPTAQSVIVYFIPFSRNVVESNIDNTLASEYWAKSYIHCNKLIEKLNEYLIQKIKATGYDCIAISATHNFDLATLTSYWSHKHAAYICGLGSFGLHQMIITEKGCCGRISSLITSMPLPEKEIKYKEYCLYKYNKSCGMCINRCVIGSLSFSQFDRFSCYKQCLVNKELYANLGIADVCGKCMVGVPCSKQDPLASLSS